MLSNRIGDKKTFNYLQKQNLLQKSM